MIFAPLVRSGLIEQMGRVRAAINLPALFKSALPGLLFAFVSLRAAKGAGDVVYNNGAANLLDGYEMTAWVLADDFSVATPARVTTLKFATLEGSGRFQGSFRWQIYAMNSSNSPGALLITGTTSDVARTATGRSFFGYDEYLNTFDIPATVLSPGTYWLALHHGPLSNNVDERLYWAVTDKNTTLPSQSIAAPFTASWTRNAPPDYRLPSEFSFQVLGTPGPVIAASNASAMPPKFSFTSENGQVYRVEYKDEITDLSWTAMAGADAISGTGGLIQITDPDAAATKRTHRFYRVAFSYDPAALPPIVDFARVNTTPRVSFLTTAGHSYRVEYRDELTDPFWAAVEGAESIAGTGGIVQVSDPTAGPRQRRFYRVILL